LAARRQVHEFGFPLDVVTHLPEIGEEDAFRLRLLHHQQIGKRGQTATKAGQRDALGNATVHHIVDGLRPDTLTDELVGDAHLREDLHRAGLNDQCP
jgi:hypothetical protein